MYARPAQLAGQVNVDPYRVYVRGPRIYVETNVSNHGMQPILVSRDAWALRLASGEVLGRSSGVTSTHAPYTIQPGETRRVFVDFMKEGVNLTAAADGAVLVVAGVSFGADPTPRVIGEIPISQQRFDQTFVAAEAAPAGAAATSLDGTAVRVETNPPQPIESPQQPVQSVGQLQPEQAGGESPPPEHSNAGAPPACVPGRSVQCAGPGGCGGFQVCAPDGTKFEPCQCPSNP